MGKNIDNLDLRPEAIRKMESYGEPYPGLQPFTEENRDMFFGREAEREILIDKIMSNKLTLLFSATGVGKSSLLMASVLPELKRANRENLDVVYFRDWVQSPVENLKTETVHTLQIRGKVPRDFQPDESLSLKDFFRGCAAFSSNPLVIVLDQFEEFFQYQRFREGFEEFVAGLSACISDRETPTAFVISMREDFALELNAFKSHLPTTLFENFFRLEKLAAEMAEAAIRKPVEEIGFRYEDELLNELLQDLSDREKKFRFGKAGAPDAEGAPAFVEPPYIQIVCTHLWKTECGNPGKTIRMDAYLDAGRAKGVVNSYFKSVMEDFYPSEKSLASKAFDHLVTPYGTKMAYTAIELGRKLRVDETDLEKTLNKLHRARILRDQKREGVVWYELYHDIFSRIIYEWNEAYKTKEMTKKVIKWGLAGFATIVLLLMAHNIYINLSNHHFRLNLKTDDAVIELHRGKADSPDYFGLQKFEFETGYERREIEPDKIFPIKHIEDCNTYTEDLIGMLPLENRIESYWECDRLNKVQELAQITMNASDITEIRNVIGLLASFDSEQTYAILRSYLTDTDDYAILSEILENIVFMPDELIIQPISAVMKREDPRIKSLAISTLGQIGNPLSLTRLRNALQDTEWDIRREAVNAIGNLGTPDSIDALSSILKNDPEWDVRRAAADALGMIGGYKAVIPLLEGLKDSSLNVRDASVDSLGYLSDFVNISDLADLLKNQKTDVRVSAISAIGSIGRVEGISLLSKFHQDMDGDVRNAIAMSLGDIGKIEGMGLLSNLLKDSDIRVRRSAAKNFGRIKSEKGIPFLTDALKDGSVMVRDGAAFALGFVGGEKAIPLLKETAKDQSWWVRATTAWSLGLIGSTQGLPLLKELTQDQESWVRTSAGRNIGEIQSTEGISLLADSLKDKDDYVRRNAVRVIGQIGNAKGFPILRYSLKDKSPEVRNAAIYALGSIGDTASISLLLYALKDKEVWIRSAATSALSLIGSVEGIFLLGDTIKHQSLEIRRFSSRSLEEEFIDEIVIFDYALKDKPNWKLSAADYIFSSIIESEGLSILAGALKEHDEELRRDAASITGKYKCSEGVSILVSALKDQSYRVREAAAFSLGEIGSKEEANHLLSLLKDRNKDVRRTAVRALGKIGGPECISHLTGALKDREEDVRIEAVLALVNIDSHSNVVDEIKSVFDDENEPVPVKLAASIALLRLGSSYGLEFLKEYLNCDIFKHRKLIAESLGKAPSEQGLEFLVSLLDDEAIHVRLKAISSLGKYKEKTAIGKLHECLDNEDARIRKAAVKSIRNIASPESVEFLVKLISKPKNLHERVRTKMTAIEALGRIGNDASVKHLKDILENGDEQYKAKALDALMEINPQATQGTLTAMLDKLRENRTEWRKIRKELEQTDDEGEKKEIKSRMKKFAPRRLMEYCVARHIARMSPEGEGINLLADELSSIRNGAWKGIGSLGNADLLEKIYNERKNTEKPWFRHAAYRAMDETLKHIEILGGSDDFKVLTAFKQRLDKAENQGLYSRVEWTMNRLKEKIDAANAE